MQPLALRVRDRGRELVVLWPDGSESCFDARRLWAECPSSRGRRRRIDDGGIAPVSDVRITGVDLVGLYGVNIAFSDGHDRGIYPWPFLARLGNGDARRVAEFSAA